MATQSDGGAFNRCNQTKCLLSQRLLRFIRGGESIFYSQDSQGIRMQAVVTPRAVSPHFFGTALFLGYSEELMMVGLDRKAFNHGGCGCEAVELCYLYIRCTTKEKKYSVSDFDGIFFHHLNLFLGCMGFSITTIYLKKIFRY